MSRSLLFMVTLLSSSLAFSQQATESGTITKLLVHNDPANTSTSQRVRVSLSGTIQDDHCSTTGDWVINLNNEAAKAQYSFLLASYISGKEVRLTGNPATNCINGQEVIRNVEPN